MVNSSSSSAHPLARDRVYSEATLERLSYQHAPSIAERTSQARLAARRRMSERHGVAVVEMVEEQPPAPAEDAVEELDSEEATKLARRARRAARKAQKEAERAAEMARQLETTARRLFYGGFLALPLLWLVSLIYFHKEHKSPDANPNIKRWYKLTIVMFTVYTAIFVGWVITFQIGADTRFRNINIIHLPDGIRSPNNL